MEEASTTAVYTGHAHVREAAARSGSPASQPHHNKLCVMKNMSSSGVELVSSSPPWCYSNTGERKGDFGVGFGRSIGRLLA